MSLLFVFANSEKKFYKFWCFLDSRQITGSHRAPQGKKNANYAPPSHFQNEKMGFCDILNRLKIPQASVKPENFFSPHQFFFVKKNKTNLFFYFFILPFKTFNFNFPPQYSHIKLFSKTFTLLHLYFFSSLKFSPFFFIFHLIFFIKKLIK